MAGHKPAKPSALLILSASQVAFPSFPLPQVSRSPQIRNQALLRVPSPHGPVKPPGTRTVNQLGKCTTGSTWRWRLSLNVAA